MRPPRASTILKINRLSYDPGDLGRRAEFNFETASIRGTLIHRACRYLGMGIDPVPWKDPNPTPSMTLYREWLDQEYLEGYRKFRRDHYWKMTDSEREFVSDIEFVVSHPDQIGYLDDNPWLADTEIKTGAIPPWVNLQTALQVMSMNERLQVRRHVLNLPGGGRYKLIPHTDVSDFREARSLIAPIRTIAKYKGDFWTAIEQPEEMWA